MLEWETTRTRASEQKQDEQQKAMRPEVERPILPPDDWQDWEQNAWRSLVTAALPYAAGHLLFAFHNHLPNIVYASLKLQLGAFLFLVGAILLWRVNRMLDQLKEFPDADSRLLETCCLIVSLFLSLSPCLWWLLHRW